jgi:ribonuclease P protein component
MTKGSKASYKIFSLKDKKSFDFANKDAFLLKSRFFIIVAKKIPENMLPKLIGLPWDVILRRGLQHKVRFLGMKASKKIGGAVERNLAKRRIRAIFYEYCKKISDIQDSISVIIIPNKLLITSKYSEIQSNFEYLLRKFL